MKVWIQRVLRLTIGGVFVYASLDKIIRPDRLAEILMDYQILPPDLVNISAIWLPCLELLVGILCLSGIWLRACSLLLTGLSLLFLGAILSTLVRGIPVVCGCFSVSSQDFKTWGSLWQESLLLLGCILLWATTIKGNYTQLNWFTKKIEGSRFIGSTVEEPETLNLST